MDGVDRERRRWRSFKERLGFKVMGCCGTTWGFGSMNTSVRDGDGDGVVEVEERVDPSRNPDPGCINPAPVSSGMNLAEALAAERHFRAAPEPERDSAGIKSPGTPLRVSLMRLLEEEEVEESGTEMGSDSMCCVCMGRKKGAAFIPCGHTFCRMCSRELWLNRGCCPLCSRSILEILDIF
ncbi:LON peptidase N-terminal domain and RING finger protein 2-like isoform X2 [Hibiscus syriacus]|nr:LON peptidase N-terminal domain and RING finger protein 2-like isoform X2 [Hibiscus syriacus]